MAEATGNSGGQSSGGAGIYVIGLVVIALAIGGMVGLVNGIFVAIVRLQPIVVTLSTMFIVQGITLLIMDKPGGMIAPEFSAFLAGDAIPGMLPAPVLVVEQPLRRRLRALLERDLPGARGHPHRPARSAVARVLDQGHARAAGDARRRDRSARERQRRARCSR